MRIVVCLSAACMRVTVLCLAAVYMRVAVCLSAARMCVAVVCFGAAVV